MATKKDEKEVKDRSPEERKRSTLESPDKQSGDQGVIGEIQQSGREIAERSIGAVGSRTRTAASGYKSEITSGLYSLADGLRKTSETFQENADDQPLPAAGARYIEDLANKIEWVSNYFEGKDPSAVAQDVKRFARENPTIFVGGAFVVGFAISRLFRSATPTGAPQSRARA